MKRWHALVTWEGSEQRAANGITRLGLADQLVLPTERVDGPRGPRTAALVPGYLVLGADGAPDWPALQRTPGVIRPLSDGAGQPAALSEADVGRLHVMELLAQAEQRERALALSGDQIGAFHARQRRRRRRPRRSRNGATTPS